MARVYDRTYAGYHVYAVQVETGEERWETVAVFHGSAAQESAEARALRLKKKSDRAPVRVAIYSPTHAWEAKP